MRTVFERAVGWAIAAIVIAALTVGLGGVLFELGHRLILFGGEILLWIGRLLGS